MAGAFTANQKCWLRCVGEFQEEPYGLYEGTITTAADQDVKIELIADGKPLSLSAGWNSVAPGTVLECAGAPGSLGRASLMPRDPNFPEGQARATHRPSFG